MEKKRIRLRKVNTMHVNFFFVSFFFLLIIENNRIKPLKYNLLKLLYFSHIHILVHGPIC